MTAPELPLEGNRLLLQQGVTLLELLSDERYAWGVGGRSSVGAQYRHLLDHYLAFFRGLAAGRIDYEAREREALLEHSRSAALGVTRQCLAALEALAGQPERPLEVREESGWSASSAGRELQFLAGHTVHHFALIRLLLHDELPALGGEFGVAPSTLSHQRTSH